MDDENSDDELPSISLSQDSVLSLNHSMPSAREVADERARERRTELELQRLRAQHSPPAAPRDAAPPPPRSDSSGSEGEAVLAAAVRALRVQPAPPRARAAHASTARRLLALLPAPERTLQPFIAAFADDASPTVLRKLINRMVHGVSCALSCEYNAWREDEAVTCAGVVLAACLAPRPAPPPRRALHRALALSRPHPALAPRLATLARRAATGDEGGGARGGGAEAARALLVLSDCARGGPQHAELLAALLVRRALALLLAKTTDNSPEPLSAPSLLSLVAGGWRGLAPAARPLALRLVARALAGGAGEGGAGEGGAGEGGAGEGGAGEGGARARVLAALAVPPQHADKQHPDYLKVAAAASTLQLLFRAPHSSTQASTPPTSQ